MLYVIAEQLGFPGILNLIRYISFRAGAASATALLIGLLLLVQLPQQPGEAGVLALAKSHQMPFAGARTSQGGVFQQGQAGDAPTGQVVLQGRPTERREGHHHIPVIDAQQKLVGIITQSDLVRSLYRAVSAPQQPT